MDLSMAYDSDEIVSPNNRRLTRVISTNDVYTEDSYSTEEPKSAGSSFSEQTLVPQNTLKTDEITENITDEQVQELLQGMNIDSSEEDDDDEEVEVNKIEVKKISKLQKKKANVNSKVTKKAQTSVNPSEKVGQKEPALLDTVVEKEIKTKRSKRGQKDNADTENDKSPLPNKDLIVPPNDYKETEKDNVIKSKPERPKRVMRSKTHNAQEVSSQSQLEEKPSKKGKEAVISNKVKSNDTKERKTKPKIEKAKPIVEPLEVDLNKTITEEKDDAKTKNDENISTKPTKKGKKNVSQASKEISKPLNKPLTAIEQVPTKNTKKDTQNIVNDEPSEPVQKQKKKATSAKEDKPKVPSMNQEVLGESKTKPRGKKTQDKEKQPLENKENITKKVEVTKRVTRKKQAV